MATPAELPTLAINPAFAVQLATAPSSPIAEASSMPTPSGYDDPSGQLASSGDQPDPWNPGPSSFSATADDPQRQTIPVDLDDPPPLYGEPAKLPVHVTPELIAEAAATGRPLIPEATAPGVSSSHELGPSSTLPGDPGLAPPQEGVAPPSVEHRGRAGWLIFLPLAAGGAAAGIAATQTKRKAWIAGAAVTAALATAVAGYVIEE